MNEVLSLAAFSNTSLWLVVGVFAMGVLYASVGHGGASGYIAVMGLLALAPAEIRPAALVLNVAVALIGSLTFWRQGFFHAKLLLPFVVSALPFAFIGGALPIKPSIFKILVGLVLLFSAWRLFAPQTAVGASYKPESWGTKQWSLALLAGAAIGLLAGLTGTGGGIFLSPLLILLALASPRETAAVSAPFILLNSMAGLAGLYFHAGAQVFQINWLLPVLAAAVLGGTLGAQLGAKLAPPQLVKRLLAAVLVLAGSKLLFT